MPVYNEAQVVKQTITQVLAHYGRVICVNDGSKDNSSEVIAETSAVLIEHPINLGAGAATQTGIDYALADKQVKYFVTFDADGQHHIEDVAGMIEHLKQQELDVVFGSRFMGVTQNISAVKRLFLGLARLFSKFDSGVALSDPHIGLRVFNRKFASNLNITMPDFAHASEIVHRIKEGGYGSLGDGQVDFSRIFSLLAEYDYDGWAILEWECCIKSPEQGAAEGAPFIRKHMIEVTDVAFDDFAGSSSDKKKNRKILGLPDVSN